MIDKSAKFSVNRQYRYWLKRVWDSTEPPVIFIGLNPSTADERTDDATIRRCQRFARDWGYGGIIMLNLFAFRSTDPRMLRVIDNPAGARNDEYLRMICMSYRLSPIVLAWGNHGEYLARARYVTNTVLGPFRNRLKCFGTSKKGHPLHPLRLAAATRMQRWPT